MESLPVCSHTQLPLKFKIYNPDKNWELDLFYFKVSSVLELETPILFFGRFSYIDTLRRPFHLLYYTYICYVSTIQPDLSHLPHSTLPHINTSHNRSLSPASPLLPTGSPDLITNHNTGHYFLIYKIFLFFHVIRLESTSIIILNKEIEIEGRRDRAGDHAMII